jgi:hypothetical protein
MKHVSLGIGAGAASAQGLPFGSPNTDQSWSANQASMLDSQVFHPHSTVAHASGALPDRVAQGGEH